MRRALSSAVVLLAFFTLCGSVYASSGTFMDFQGIHDLQAVGDFYNGAGLANTPNYGVSFSSNFLAMRSFFGPNPGSGNFAPPPLGTPAIFMNGSVGSNITGTMNVAPGFSNGINFFFTAGFTGNQVETVKVWSGANGTGTVLATITLANNNAGCKSPAYCMWSNAGATFTGTAHSVTFSGPADELGLADITLGGSTTAIPEPSTWYMLGTGVVSISLSQLRRFFKT